MLKIKDDVDLKELEKFGIRRKVNKMFDILTGEPIISVLYTKGDISSGIFINENKIIRCAQDDILYDLIKADLVEKVEE